MGRYEKTVNLAQMIERAAEGEPIESAVIGEYNGYGNEHAKQPINVPLSWEEARPWLDYEYDNGYGGADCNPVWAWTASWVLYVGEYDGATHVGRLPRHPIAAKPYFS